MSLHRYPVSSLRADYVRAGVGFALTVALAAMAARTPLVATILSICAVVFLAFGIRTWQRYRLIFDVDTNGISTSGGGCVNLPWNELTEVKLRYYATKRDRTGGWIHLNLVAGRKKLSLESSLEGFSEIARQAASQANARGLELDQTTRSNFLALGVMPLAKSA